MPVVITYRKPATVNYNPYELQSINLDTTQECSEWFKETKCFQKKENSSNSKREECYNYDITEHFT